MKTAVCVFYIALTVGLCAQSADGPLPPAPPQDAPRPEGEGRGAPPPPFGQNARHNSPPPRRGEGAPPGLKRRGISFHINARVLEKEDAEEWGETWSVDSVKNAIPGQPVSLKLVGNNVVVVVQFMPYIRRNAAGVLVAQGQVWMEDENHNVRYQTTIQSIPLTFNEKIYYFPLGEQDNGSNAFIEICLEMSPYSE
jgi:hypothetical protein